MPLRWGEERKRPRLAGRGMDPDDPRWLTLPPLIECYDTRVLEQLSIPRALLQLAKRRCGDAVVVRPGGGELGARSTVVHADLSFLDELEEDPDARPYVWDLPEDESCR